MAGYMHDSLNWDPPVTLVLMEQSKHNQTKYRCPLTNYGNLYSNNDTEDNFDQTHERLSVFFSKVGFLQENFNFFCGGQKGIVYAMNDEI